MIRKDLKIGLIVGSAIVVVGWVIFALRSETPQQRRQQQFANEAIQYPENSPAEAAPETAPFTASEPKPALTETETIHIVSPGETLSSIAVQYFGTSAAWQKILDANTDILQSPSQLRPGMKLKIPAK